MKRKLSHRHNHLTRDWSRQLGDLLRRISSREIFINLGDSSTVFTESDCIRAISESFPESPIRNLVLKCLADVESRSAGASLVALGLISGIKLDPVDHGKRFTMSDLDKSLRLISDNLTADIVIDSIRIAGRQGKIFLDSSDVQTTEITYGSQVCKWKPDQKFFELFHHQKASLQDCKVVFIDGIIESVAEIHNLFNTSYEQKIPIVIFARGYADDVISTSVINLQRKTAQIIPITIPFDEIGVNGMADLASCFGSDVITSDKGQLISNIKLDECVSTLRVSCSMSGTEIEFKNDMMDHVVERLSTKLQSCEPSQADLLRRRIDALGNSCVTVKLGSDKKSISGIQRDRVDFGIRYVTSCLRYGTLNFNGLTLPYRSVKLGTECAESFLRTLRKNGAVLEVDRCG